MTTKPSDKNRIIELTNILSKASEAYYQQDREIMSNLEYDKLYDELVKLEEETGIVMSGSPTRKVGFELLSELPKERHATKMLSLDKTKDREALAAWLGNHEGLLSWKLDGLTIVLTYEDGILTKGVTRGNGEIGEVITNNVKVFDNIPLKIPVSGTVVIRGEAVIPFEEFERINAELPPEEQYKNPRNLCSGTVRQLNNEVTAGRHVRFYAFALVQSGSADSPDSKMDQLKMLTEWGFETVETAAVNKENVVETVGNMEKAISHNPFGSDGLVLTFDSSSYSASLGATSKFPRHSIAFKWQDEIQETSLIEVEWSASRTGLINPVAIFEPVELEGTTVSRASLHNISIMEELALGIGDRIQVYKANMIIPQVAENLTRSGLMEIPENCPVCGEPTRIKDVNEVKVLLCDNVDCAAKKIKSFAHFAGRDAMNIEGLSEATLEKFIAAGILHQLSDLFELEKHKEAIEAMEGMGEKSYTKLLVSIEKSRHVGMDNFLYALGIANVGLSNARLMCKAFGYDIEKILSAQEDELAGIEGFGSVIAASVAGYFNDQGKRRELERLLSIVDLETPEASETAEILAGKTFVITGSVSHYTNRNALKSHIESLGGKVTGSVSKNTDYLVNNDTASTSGKNKKAKELGIPVISEEEFLAMVENG